ncbi:MAG: acyl-CoA thioesterase II [Leucobacter sp.]|jgi:acyl-CoA thioesterase-2|nr:acyl-CoA thioesterase II [Leucobacter sp.]
MYGGQLLSQAAFAAAHTVESGREMHSMHAHFLLPGDSSSEVEYHVVPLRDGGSFSSRRVDAVQLDRTIFSAMLSFQRPTDGLRHQLDLPSGVPGPDDPHLERIFEPVEGDNLVATDLFEVRMISDGAWPSAVPMQNAGWVRLREDLTGSDSVQRAALAYLSDSIIQWPVLREHELSWWPEDMATWSLDHAIWWHETPRVSEWMLFVQETPRGGDGRAMTTSRIYSADGRILATCAQEMLLRAIRPTSQ